MCGRAHRDSQVLLGLLEGDALFDRIQIVRRHFRSLRAASTCILHSNATSRIQRRRRITAVEHGMLPERVVDRPEPSWYFSLSLVGAIHWSS